MNDNEDIFTSYRSTGKIKPLIKGEMQYNWNKQSTEMFIIYLYIDKCLNSLKLCLDTMF